MVGFSVFHGSGKLNTTENNDELIYHYDENENTVECTGLTLFEYLDDVYKRYEEGKNRKQIICRGELLEIFV